MYCWKTKAYCYKTILRIHPDLGQLCESCPITQLVVRNSIVFRFACFKVSLSRCKRQKKSFTVGSVKQKCGEKRKAKYSPSWWNQLIQYRSSLSNSSMYRSNNERNEYTYATVCVYIVIWTVPLTCSSWFTFRMVFFVTQP